MTVIVPMVKRRPLFNVTGGRDIWHQGEREDSHVTGYVRDFQSYLGVSFHDCAIASVFWRNGDEFLLHFSVFWRISWRKQIHWRSRNVLLLTSGLTKKEGLSKASLNKS